MTRLGAATGILPAPDLDLEVLEATSELRLEQVIQDIAAVGLGVIPQQPGIATRTDRPHPLKDPAGIGTADGHLQFRRRGFSLRHDRPGNQDYQPKNIYPFNVLPHDSDTPLFVTFSKTFFTLAGMAHVRRSIYNAFIF